jgi:hypothetical protein
MAAQLLTCPGVIAITTSSSMTAMLGGSCFGCTSDHIVADEDVAAVYPKRPPRRRYRRQA